MVGKILSILILKVASKTIHGKLHKTSITLSDPGQHQARVPLVNLSSFEVKEAIEQHLLAGDISIITPQLGNLHQLKALEHSAFYDVFIPPYSPPIRNCTYYSFDKSKNKVTAIAPPSSFACVPLDYIPPFGAEWLD